MQSSASELAFKPFHLIKHETAQQSSPFRVETGIEGRNYSYINDLMVWSDRLFFCHRDDFNSAFRRHSPNLGLPGWPSGGNHQYSCFGVPSLGHDGDLLS